MTTMGGGNGQKAKMARERNLEKHKGAKGSQLEANKKAMNIQCKFHLVKSLLSFRSRAHSHGHYHLRQWPALRFLATFRRLPKFSSSCCCLSNINAHSPTNLHCRRRNQGL
ncbi:hypothetical protein LWI28_010053 [Acer negundo]|uniref:Small EDRK-rich factor-like N-terminal domain-containing protein n=1 Tax=Acer negundo TaxID=4023 RepID=A0AAD5NTJ9_ACENE|nr:hypothetical protein LWI28_010053 [Acer negundo]